MSTAGRINKSGPKFIPKRKNAAPSTNNNKEQSKSVTPRQTVTPLPPLEPEESNPNKNLSPPRPTTSKALPTPASNSSPGSLFGPSDPSLRFSQPSSSAESSQPFSSFAFTPRDPSATQATSVGPSSQPPQFSQNPSSPQAGSSQLPRQTRDSAASSSRNATLDTPAIAVVKPTSGPKGKGKGKGNGNVKGKGKETNSKEDTEEDIDVGSGEGTSQNGSRPELKKRATRARKVGKKGKEAEIAEGEFREESASDGEAQDAPPSPDARTTRRTSQPRKRAAPKKSAREDAGSGGTEAGNGDAGQSSSEDEYDKIKPKKRRVRAPPKRGKVDEMLFGDDNSDGDGSEGGEAEAEVEVGSDGEPRKGRKKRSRKDVDEPLPLVDPSQTTMSQLADPNLKFDLGRPSERTLFFEKRKVDRKTALKLKRQKMKARQKRKEQGLDSGTEDDPVDGNGVGGEGVAGTSRDKGKGRAMADGLGSRETSPQVLDAAKAMALIGGIRGMDQDDGDDQSAGSQHGDSTMADAVAGSSREQNFKDGEKNDETDDGEDDYGDLVETSYAPQMRIVNGQLVIDEESLQIDRSQPTDTGPREIVEESAQDRFVNSRSFSKKPGKAKKWSLDETERFYDALSQFGTDFELISALFPGRNRREIKLKWTKEDKINSKKITAALMQRKKIDLDSYSKLSGQDLSGPMPDDPMDEINERRAKLESENVNIGNNGQRRGNDAGQGNLVDKKGKGKKKKGPIDEAGAELFNEENIRRAEEEAEAARLQAEVEEEERQAAIEAAEMSD